jgi:hypothetical protein
MHQCLKHVTHPVCVLIMKEKWDMLLVATLVTMYMLIHARLEPF